VTPAPAKGVGHPEISIIGIGFTPLRVDRPVSIIISLYLPISMGIVMQTVILSPKYQVVIPKTIRKGLHLLPVQMMQMLEHTGQ